MLKSTTTTMIAGHLLGDRAQLAADALRGAAAAAHAGAGQHRPGGGEHAGVAHDRVPQGYQGARRHSPLLSGLEALHEACVQCSSGLSGLSAGLSMSPRRLRLPRGSCLSCLRLSVGHRVVVVYATVVAQRSPRCHQGGQMVKLARNNVQTSTKNACSCIISSVFEIHHRHYRQDGPRWPQNGPKMAQDGRVMPEDEMAPKMASERPDGQAGQKQRLEQQQ